MISVLVAALGGWLLGAVWNMALSKAWVAGWWNEALPMLSLGKAKRMACSMVPAATSSAVNNRGAMG